MCDFLLTLLSISKPRVCEYRSTVYIMLGFLEIRLFLNGSNRVLFCSFPVPPVRRQICRYSVRHWETLNVSSTTFSIPY